MIERGKGIGAFGIKVLEKVNKVGRDRSPVSVIPSGITSPSSLTDTQIEEYRSRKLEELQARANNPLVKVIAMGDQIKRIKQELELEDAKDRLKNLPQEELAKEIVREVQVRAKKKKFRLIA